MNKLGLSPILLLNRDAGETWVRHRIGTRDAAAKVIVAEIGKGQSPNSLNWT